MDRSLGSFARLVRQFVGNAIVGPRVDYLASYPCVAVKQNGDGTLELQPDDPRIAPQSAVPIRYGVPGVSATIAAGGRVMLAFTGGDPAKPIATVWESASVTALTFAGGSQGVARTADAVAVASAMNAWISAVTAQLNSAGPVAGASGALIAPVDFGTISGGSSVVKAG